MLSMAKKFSRRIENFKCVVCGYEAIGNGYTDHCPNCLHSLHVDINPGDRLNKCRGIMKPIRVSIDRRGAYWIDYLCLSCKKQKTVVAAANDNKEALKKLAF